MYVEVRKNLKAMNGRHNESHFLSFIEEQFENSIFSIQFLRLFLNT